MPDIIITSEELAELLHVPVNTVHYWRARGTGPKGVKVGKRILYRRERRRRVARPQGRRGRDEPAGRGSAGGDGRSSPTPGPCTRASASTVIAASTRAEPIFKIDIGDRGRQTAGGNGKGEWWCEACALELQRQLTLDV